jgi:hypothetical protein
MRERLSLVVLAVTGIALMATPSRSDPASTGTKGGRSFTTPNGIRVLVRGGCLLIPVRKGASKVKRDHAWCDRMTGVDLDRAYSWVPDFMALALDNAERAECGGAIGCVAGGRDVEIILAGDGIPNALVAGDTSQLTIVVSTGLIDFVEAAETTYLDEVKAGVLGKGPTGGFSDWLTEIDAMGGKPCTFRAPSPLHRHDQADFTQLRTAAQVFYEFIMAHEISHVRSPGANCWAGDHPQDMARELACDHRAFSKLASTSPPRALPVLMVPPLVGMSHYEHILNSRLGRLVDARTGAPFLDRFPASNWTVRADRLVSEWEKHCSAVGEDTTVCRPGWKVAVADARRLLALKLPSQCIDTASSVSTELQPVGPSKVTKQPLSSDPTCRGLETAILSASAAFEPIKGPLDDGDEDPKTWKSTVTWGDAEACLVWKSTGEAPYWSCDLIGDRNPAKVEAAFPGYVAKMKDCLASGWSFDESKTDSKAFIRMVKAMSATTSHVVRLRMRRDSRGASVTLTVE